MSIVNISNHTKINQKDLEELQKRMELILEDFKKVFDPTADLTGFDLSRVDALMNLLKISVGDMYADAKKRLVTKQSKEMSEQKRKQCNKLINHKDFKDDKILRETQNYLNVFRDLTI